MGRGVPRIRGTRAIGDCPVGDLALLAIFQLRIYFSLFHLIHRFKHLQSGKTSQAFRKCWEHRHYIPKSCELIVPMFPAVEREEKPPFRFSLDLSQGLVVCTTPSPQIPAPEDYALLGIINWAEISTGVKHLGMNRGSSHGV